MTVHFRKVGFEDVLTNSLERTQTNASEFEVLSSLLEELQKWYPKTAHDDNESNLDQGETEQIPDWENNYGKTQKMLRTLSQCPFRREYRPRQDQKGGTGPSRTPCCFELYLVFHLEPHSFLRIPKAFIGDSENCLFARLSFCANTHNMVTPSFTQVEQDSVFVPYVEPYLHFMLR